MPGVDATIALVLDIGRGNTIGGLNVKLARTGDIHPENVIQCDDLLGRVPRGEELSRDHRLNGDTMDLIFESVSDVEIRHSDVNLANVCVHGRDALDGRAEILHGIGARGNDSPVRFVDANEIDRNFVAGRRISEDELPECLDGLGALDANIGVLHFVAGAVVLEGEGSAFLLDDRAFFGIIGSSGGRGRQFGVCCGLG